MGQSFTDCKQSQSSSRRPIRFCKASPPSPSGKPSDLSNGHSPDPPNALSNGHALSAQSLSNAEGSGGTVLENGVLQTGKLELNGDLDKEEKVNGEEKKRSSRVNQCASFIPNEPAADELESENEKIGRKYSYVSIDLPVFIVTKKTTLTTCVVMDDKRAKLNVKVWKSADKNEL